MKVNFYQFCFFPLIIFREPHRLLQKRDKK